MIVVYPSVLDEMYARVAKGLRERDPALVFTAVVTGRPSRAVVERVMNWERVLVHSDYRRAATAVDMDLLREVERDGAEAVLTWYAGADRVIWRFARERYLRDLTAACRLAVDALHGATAVIAEGVDDLPSYLLFALARHRGIPFLTVQNTRFPGRIVVQTDFPRDRFERAEALHQRFRASGLDPEQRSRAEAFLRDFREKAIRPRIVSVYRRPGLDRSASRQFTRSARDWLGDPWDNAIVHPVDLVGRRLARLARGPLADRFLFEDPRPGEPYVLFPLHFQPEASTLVRGAPYVDQPALIETIAKAIPVDHRLYVKEHMYAIGRRPLSYYRRLRALPNVRLIRAETDSHQLIKGSRLVTTITGTMGWEAIVYGIRVLVFGYAFYSRVAGVHEAKDLRELPETVRRVLESPPPDEADLVRFVAALFEGTYEGQIGHPEEVPESVSDVNLDRLTKAVARELAAGRG